MRYNWNPIEKCAAELESQPKSAGAGRDGPNIRYCEPTKIPANPGKSPIQRRPGRTAAGRENPQSNAVPAGPPPAGKIPKPNRLVTAAVAVAVVAVAAVAVVVVATRESRLCRQ